MPNTALKAFQKNAVQSYFERQQHQQQQHQQQQQQSPTVSPSKDTAQSNNNSAATSPQNTARPQSLPLIKTTNHTQMIAQSRSSLPAKLSQMINVGIGQPPPQPLEDTLLINGSQNVGLPPSNRSSMAPLSPTESTIYYQAIFGQVVQPEQPAHKVHQGVLDSRIMTIEPTNLQAHNESGVPPPPPRRSKQAMPLRRYVGHPSHTIQAMNHQNACIYFVSSL